MQHARLFPFRQHHALRVSARLGEDRLHKQVGFVDELGEFIDVGIEIFNRPRRHAGVHRRFSHRWRDLHDQTRVKWFRDNVVGAEAQILIAVGGGHHFALLGVRQLCDSMNGGELHLFVDCRSADVQRTAEDEREAEHVVHLVRVVRTSGTDDRVFTHRLRQRRQNFRLRVRQGQDHWRARHLLHHLLGQYFRA
ncbi:Uncharacterised protein [Enterobacter hormaechei]|nr:Uncharacterised protein [Enterobacter hormaechei]